METTVEEIEGEVEKGSEEPKEYRTKEQQSRRLGVEISRMVVPESQPWENGSDYGNVGANGGDKIMERSVRADRGWYLQNMDGGTTLKSAEFSTLFLIKILSRKLSKY